MSGFLNFLGQIFFPTACPFCGTLDFPSSVEQAGCCPKCGKTLLYEKEQSRLVTPEFAPFCDEVFCCSYYGGAVQEAMTKYKFSGETYMGPCFGKILYGIFMGTELLSFVDFITVVPISGQRFRERGYNQSVPLARRVSQLSGVPFYEVLERSVQGKSQRELLSRDRRVAGESKFQLKKEASPLLQGKTVLLIDDILTTGSTLNRCAGLLKEGGATWVAGACVASGRKEFT